MYIVDCCLFQLDVEINNLQFSTGKLHDVVQLDVEINNLQFSTGKLHSMVQLDVEINNLQFSTSKRRLFLKDQDVIW